MAKERKTRNFDFLKEPLPELPSREEVIQKTVALTGQASVSSVSIEVPPSVLTPIIDIEIPKEVEKTIKPAKKKAVTPSKSPKPTKKTLLVEDVPKEKSKVGRPALEDTRKPFTSTITVENKKRLRQLCAEYDIAMSDALNEILAAQFEKRPPIYTL